MPFEGYQPTTIAGGEVRERRLSSKRERETAIAENPLPPTIVDAGLGTRVSMPFRSYQPTTIAGGEVRERRLSSKLK
eukprot:COSAG02_NODE_3559_length_6563_cov_4.152382_5_plen_77_part_00